MRMWANRNIVLFLSSLKKFVTVQSNIHTHTHTHITKSLCYTPETKTTL